MLAKVTGKLLPTKITGALNHFQYMIRKGSVSDRLFKFHSLDVAPKAATMVTPPAPDLLQIGTGDTYEVESIVSKRKRGKRTQYEIKWQGWGTEYNTWESASRIDHAMVRAFDGQQPRRSRVAAPPQFKRGSGCARARLSVAAQKRGGVVQTISMVCGNVQIHMKEPISRERMPTLALTFKVLSMDKNGHIIWPTSFDTVTQAALRKQARTLLRAMIDDPLNPTDATMEPAMTGTGTSSVWVGAPQRQLVIVHPEIS